jgi:hypothetical protein
MTQQDVINYISRQIRESRIEYKRLLTELHKEITILQEDNGQ